MLPGFITDSFNDSENELIVLVLNTKVGEIAAKFILFMIVVVFFGTFTTTFYNIKREKKLYALT